REGLVAWIADRSLGLAQRLLFLFPHNDHQGWGRRSGEIALLAHSSPSPHLGRPPRPLGPRWKRSAANLWCARQGLAADCLLWTSSGRESHTKTNRTAVPLLTWLGVRSANQTVRTMAAPIGAGTSPGSRTSSSTNKTLKQTAARRLGFGRSVRPCRRA